MARSHYEEARIIAAGMKAKVEFVLQQVHLRADRGEKLEAFCVVKERRGGRGRRQEGPNCRKDRAAKIVGFAAIGGKEVKETDEADLNEEKEPRRGSRKG